MNAMFDLSIKRSLYRYVYAISRRRNLLLRYDAESILWVFNNREKKHIESQKSLLCGDEFVDSMSALM
jgi:hypothetical protein